MDIFICRNKRGEGLRNTALLFATSSLCASLWPIQCLCASLWAIQCPCLANDHVRLAKEQLCQQDGVAFFHAIEFAWMALAATPRARAKRQPVQAGMSCPNRTNCKSLLLVAHDTMMSIPAPGEATRCICMHISIIKYTWI